MSQKKAKPIVHCGFCGTGNHSYCPSNRPDRWQGCQCAAAGHRPDKKLALKLAGYRRPDLAIDGGVLLDELVAHVQKEYQPA